MKAAILAAINEPLIVDQIHMPDSELEPGQVVVRINATTICGAQLNEIAGVKAYYDGPNKYLPHCLGHEACGRVHVVGPGVTHVREGDFVVLHWRPGAGIQAKTPRYRWDAGPNGYVNAGYVTTFQEFAIVSENRCTKIPNSVDEPTASLLGCAITTAFGVINSDTEANVKVGDSVVIIGAGGVGLNLIQFAKLAGACPIIAVDIVQSKLEQAAAYGADYYLNPYEIGDISKRIVNLIGRPDKVIDTTGRRELIEAAFKLGHPKGKLISVGVPDAEVTIPSLKLHHGFTFTGSEGGNCHPERDIPRILKLIEAGRVQFQQMVTHEFALGDINVALDIMRSGDCGRVLINI